MNQYLPFEGEPKEEVLLRFRQQARRFYLVALVFILLAGVVPYLLSLELDGWMFWAAIVSFSFALLLLVISPFFRWLGQRTVVTNRRVTSKSGTLNEHRTEMLLNQVAEMKLRRGPLQRFFKTGDIVLRSVTGATLIIRNVPDLLVTADAVQDILAQEVR